MNPAHVVAVKSIKNAVGNKTFLVKKLTRAFIKDKKQNIYATTIIRNSPETLNLRDKDTGKGLEYSI